VDAAASVVSDGSGASVVGRVVVVVVGGGAGAVVSVKFTEPETVSPSAEITRYVST
jgi:hypothetical protein